MCRNSQTAGSSSADTRRKRNCCRCGSPFPKKIQHTRPKKGISKIQEVFLKNQWLVSFYPMDPDTSDRHISSEATVSSEHGMEALLAAMSGNGVTWYSVHHPFFHEIQIFRTTNGSYRHD